jgi:hypothetical protein
MSKPKSTPNFKEFVGIEQQGLRARLDAVRAAISHAGEKGRALEADVQKLIRSFLPAEYGLSTGFIVSRTPDGNVEISKQLDIIIYDALRAAPLMTIGTSDVFPIEAVYAYVEVKASLTQSKNLKRPASSSLEKCLKDNAKLRQLRERVYWSPESGSPAAIRIERIHSLAIRSYIVAFEGKPHFRTLDQLAQRLANVCKKVDSHMHGVFVADLGFVYTKPVDAGRAAPSDWYHSAATPTDQALLVLKTAMLQALATFPRPPEGYIAALEGYYGLLPEWTEFYPDVQDEP